MHGGCNGALVSFTDSRVQAGTGRELILGGQKSGKSRAAETRAARWLDIADHEALLVATARAGDADMAERIARHREERRVRIPRMKTLEPTDALADTLEAWSQPQRLVIVDCLTLWLTQLLMPPEEALAPPPFDSSNAMVAIESLVLAARNAPGPLIFVSNEIGMGVSPLSSDARRFIDALGVLHQTLAGVCDRVTLMVAGCELPVRGRRHDE